MRRDLLQLDLLAAITADAPEPERQPETPDADDLQRVLDNLAERCGCLEVGTPHASTRSVPILARSTGERWRFTVESRLVAEPRKR